jgi:hypothetical protein
MAMVLELELDEAERRLCAQALAAEAYAELNRSAGYIENNLGKVYEKVARLMARAAELTRAGE